MGLNKKLNEIFLKNKKNLKIYVIGTEHLRLCFEKLIKKLVKNKLDILFELVSICPSGSVKRINFKC